MTCTSSCQAFGQFAQRFELGELSLVAGVGDAAGAESVTQREADVVFLQNLHDLVKVVVEEILLVVVRHPLRKDGAPAADDTGDALGDKREVLNQNAGVDRHVVNALLLPALRSLPA